MPKYHTRYVDDFSFDNGPRATPLIADGRVFTLGADGDLRAWDLATGKGLWDRNVNKDYGVAKGYFGCASSPLVAGGRLLLNVGAKGAGVVAFDPATGKELWKAADDPVSYSSPVLARSAGKSWPCSSPGPGCWRSRPRRARCASATRSGRGPRRPSARPRRSSPATGSSCPPLMEPGPSCWTSKGGRPRRCGPANDILSCHYNTPLLVKGHLYGIDGRQEGGQAGLRCVEWDTGKVKWTKEAFGCAGLIHADGLVIACPENGDLVLIDPSPGGYKELARATVLESPVRALPALAGGRLFVRDGKKVLALEVGKK